LQVAASLAILVPQGIHPKGILASQRLPTVVKPFLHVGQQSYSLKTRSVGQPTGLD